MGGGGEVHDKEKEASGGGLTRGVQRRCSVRSDVEAGFMAGD